MVIMKTSEREERERRRKKPIGTSFVVLIFFLALVVDNPLFRCGGGLVGVYIMRFGGDYQELRSCSQMPVGVVSVA